MAEETGANDHLLRVIEAALPQLLRAIETLGLVSRSLHPPHLESIVRGVSEVASELSDAMAQFNATDWPDDLEGFRDCIATAGEETMAAYARLAQAPHADDPAVAAYQALRHNPRAREALYPVSAMLPPVSRFFMESEAREDPAKCARLEQADYGRDDVGLLHAGNDWSRRGGFSVYVPEFYDPDHPLPLITTLHGGSGHGRAQVWTWLREARSRGAIIVAPTSRGQTWPLTGDDTDGAHLDSILDEVKKRWRIDESRQMLTGMSDGATFSYIAGLREQAPFTHIAPFSGSFHPLLASFGSPERMAGLSFYIVHGTLDWLISVDFSRAARDYLTAAGADVLYREIADLSHTYAAEENAAVMDWFLY